MLKHGMLYPPLVVVGLTTICEGYMCCVMQRRNGLRTIFRRPPTILPSGIGAVRITWRTFGDKNLDIYLRYVRVC